MLEKLAAVSRLASKAALYASAAGLVLMTVIIGWQVLARYALGNPSSWTEQAALFLMLWFILFAAAAGVREGFHIRITVVQDRLGAGGRKALRLTCHGVVLWFGVVMAWSGAELVVATWQHVIPTLGLPRGTAYLPLSAAGVLIAFFAFEHALTEMLGGEVEPLWS